MSWQSDASGTLSQALYYWLSRKAGRRTTEAQFSCVVITITKYGRQGDSQPIEQQYDTGMVNAGVFVYLCCNKMIKEQDFLFKIVIVGNQGVGKSSLFVRFCDDNFAENYLPTIGVDFRFKMMDIEGQTCKLQIWDTAGQERFRTITSAYYRSSQVVLIVYDLTDPASFKEIEDYWIQQAKNNSDSDITICLVGNKCDMPTQILDSEISMLVQSVGLPSYAVSAKTGAGVEKMFSEICERLIKSTAVRKKERVKSSLQQREEGKKKCCR